MRFTTTGRKMTSHQLCRRYRQFALPEQQQQKPHQRDGSHFIIIKTSMIWIIQPMIWVWIGIHRVPNLGHFRMKCTQQNKWQLRQVMQQLG